MKKTYIVAKNAYTEKKGFAGKEVEVISTYATQGTCTVRDADGNEIYLGTEELIGYHNQ